jgi:peptide maturation system acyl carrier-related protein
MRREIFEGLQNIFNKRFKIDITTKGNEDFDKPLLGNEWKLEARDLLGLFLDVESEFGISIPEREIERGNFNSINNIVKIITAEIA